MQVGKHTVPKQSCQVVASLKDLVSVRRRYYTKKTELPVFPALDEEIDAAAALEDDPDADAALPEAPGNDGQGHDDTQEMDADAALQADQAADAALPEAPGNDGQGHDGTQDDDSVIEMPEPETATIQTETDPRIECLMEQVVALRHARLAAEGAIAIDSDEEKPVDPTAGDLPAATPQPLKPGKQRGRAVHADELPVPCKPCWAQEYLETAAAAPAIPIRRRRAVKAKGKSMKAAKAPKGKAKAKSTAKASASKLAKKPQVSESPSAGLPSFGGGLRLVKATGRTYIQGRAAVGERWKLVVEVSQHMTPHHQAVCEQIKSKLLANPSWGKAKALSLRAESLG